MPRPSFLVLHSDIFRRNCVFKMRDFCLLSLLCVLMERGIFCSNRLALERNKALPLDVSVVTLELCGIFSHEKMGMEGQGKVSGSLWISAPLKWTSFSVLLLLWCLPGRPGTDSLGCKVTPADFCPYRRSGVRAFPPCRIPSLLYYNTTEFSNDLLTCRLSKCF